MKMVWLTKARASYCEGGTGIMGYAWVSLFMSGDVINLWVVGPWYRLWEKAFWRIWTVLEKHTAYYCWRYHLVGD